VDKTPNPWYNTDMKNDKKINLAPMHAGRGIQLNNLGGFTLSIGFGGGHYSDNYSLRHDANPAPTETMEVAIMDADSNFVVLPDDVAGYVPVGNLGSLIEAVQSHDWERVCILCDASVDVSKHPQKQEDGSYV
jgi:hypothetical protein